MYNFGNRNWQPNCKLFPDCSMEIAEQLRSTSNYSFLYYSKYLKTNFYFHFTFYFLFIALIRLSYYNENYKKLILTGKIMPFAKIRAFFSRMITSTHWKPHGQKMGSKQFLRKITTLCNSFHSKCEIITRVHRQMTLPILELRLP